MNTLKLHTTPVPKRNSLTEMRTDGECYHFSFTWQGMQFVTTARLFGTKEAQQKTLQRLLDNPPNQVTVVTSDESMKDGIEQQRSREIQRPVKTAKRRRK